MNIEDMCEEIINKLYDDDSLFISVVGKYNEIREVIRELLLYDDIDFTAIDIEDEDTSGYSDEFVVDIWREGNVVFGCEPCIRDGEYITIGGDVLYIVSDNVSPKVKLQYDEVVDYFDETNIHEDECNGRTFNISYTDGDKYNSVSFYTNDEGVKNEIENLISKINIVKGL